MFIIINNGLMMFFGVDPFLSVISGMYSDIKITSQFDKFNVSEICNVVL